MTHYFKLVRKMMFGFAAAGALVVALPFAAGAQQVSTSYKPTKGDPFTKYTPPVRRLKQKKVATPIQPPAIQERIARYKTKKAEAMAAQRAAPKPTTALLLSELQVTGIFRTPRGYAAMVEATPIKLSYVIYPGERFFDGLLVAIEENRLVFRRETPWTDGRVETAVEPKPLRQPTAVEEMRTTRAAANSTFSIAPSDNGVVKKEETTSVTGRGNQ